jgi:hypothetical protein
VVSLTIQLLLLSMSFVVEHINIVVEIVELTIRVGGLGIPGL